VHRSVALGLIDHGVICGVEIALLLKFFGEIFDLPVRPLDVTISLVKVITSILNKALEFVEVVHESLALLVKTGDVIIVSLHLDLQVVDLFLLTCDFSILLLLELLELLKFVDLLLELFLAVILLLSALLDPVSKILHLAFEVSVYLVHFFFRFVVGFDQGLSRLTCLLVAT